MKPRAFETIVYGGLSIAILDFFDAVTFFGLYLGVPFTRIWQGVSSGLLGQDAAVSGGWSTSLLGILLHFVVAMLIALVYYLIAGRSTYVLSHPIISGIVFGTVAYFVMNYLVIPLSAIGEMPSFRLSRFLNGVIGHIFLVGIPVALIAKWSAAKDQNANH